MNHPSHRRTVIRCLACAAAWAAWPAWPQAAPERSSYSLSVVPQFPASEIHRDWTPLIERLARDTGITLTLSLSANIPRFEGDLLDGHPDFAFMNPYHQVMAARAQGYIPLVRSSKPLTGILVVRKDSPIASVRELDGKDVAFPAPNSFGASLWMRALLAEREHITIKPVYVQTHSNVYRHVIRGKAAAGGGINSTLLQEAPEVQADLRVLLETPGAAPHPLSAHPRVPARVQQQVAGALLALTSDAAGQALLKEVFGAAPVRADYARDYRPLEQFKLEKYVVTDTPG
ncbi:MAG: phosphate/phosphite/phosphonate ABC transporter substrate-binding protein [Pseudomonadota bacterium]|nr:phosphate/phosphite/phosphonate ABC transporter substrate-binding protein [Pseudomonadota bacterium]